MTGKHTLKWLKDVGHLSKQNWKLKLEFEPDRFRQETSAEAIRNYLNTGKFK